MAMNIEVPIEMLDYGAGVAFNSGTITLIRSGILLNPADYDGATFYFEIVANDGLTGGTGTSPLPGYKVELLNVTTSTSITNITNPQGVGNTTTYRSASFTPTTGANLYEIRMSMVAGGGGVAPTAGSANIWQARIVIVQSNATKTRIQIPLLSFDWTGAVATETLIDSTTATVLGQPLPQYYRRILLELSKFSTIAATNPYTLEAVLSNSTATTSTATAQLTTAAGTAVAASLLALSNTTVEQRVSVDWASDANWIDQTEYFLKIKSNKATNTVKIFRACLYIRVTSMSAVQAHIRISRRNSTASSGNQDTNMYQIKPTNYSFLTAFYEVTALLASGSAATTDDLLDGDSSTSVTNSSISVTGATRIRFRGTLPLLSMTSGDHLKNEYTVGASTTLDVQGGYLIMDVTDRNPNTFVNINHSVVRSNTY